MEYRTPHNETLSKQDLVIGTVIGLVMGILFTQLSSGMSLIVTFVPGVVFTWLIFSWLYIKQTKLPAASTFLPLFFTALAVQFIHFAEEFLSGFRTRFPLLYAGTPYADNLFVTFNMISYFVFTLSCLLVFTKQIRFLLMPVVFFVIYGATGNAISHTWWSLYLHAYFPGLATAQLYWIFGPLLLYQVLGERKQTLATILLFAFVLVFMLTFFATPSALYHPTTIRPAAPLHKHHHVFPLWADDRSGQSTVGQVENFR